MPAKTDQLKWLSLSDFSPGIQQRLMHQGGSMAPTRGDQQLGIATTNTFRCISLPGGGLGPLPKRNVTYSPDPIDAPIGNVTGGKFTISGFHVAGPVLAASSPGIDACEFHLAFEYIFSGVRRYRWQRHRMWESPAGIDTIKSINATDPTPSALFRPTFFHSFRAHSTDAAQPGNPLVAAAWYAAGGGHEKFWSTFPDTASPGTNSVKDIDVTTRAIEHLIGHQGRSLGFQQQQWSHGTPGTWSFNEQMWYTNSNRDTLQTSIAQVLGQENATGYSAAASLSASELLLIKVAGGAFLVRGDIADPTVLRLPGVVSIGNSRNQGASTPIGYVYGVRDGGVWVWNGGEVSDYLSPQLETNFWQIASNTFVDYAGRFELFREWLFAPNNWVYHFKTKSWWRIEDPSVVQILQWSSSIVNPIIYGTPATYIDTSTPVVHGFTATTPASSYQWESQPIPESIFRRMKVRQLVIVGAGAGTITVTLTTSTGATQSEVLTLTGTNRPESARRTINIEGTHVQVKIVASNGSSAAPITYEVRLGIDENKTHLAA